MKLVLLPGMDGTGELFADFVKYYPSDCVVISLPQSGAQDYVSLSKRVAKQLPDGDIVLLAESFSGGLAIELIKSDLNICTRVKGIIFVASFLSSPNKVMIKLALKLPIHVLASVSCGSILHQHLFFDGRASRELLCQFTRLVKSVPETTLKARLEVMLHQRLPPILCDIPILYLRASKDRLVSVKKGNEFSAAFSDLTYEELKGPHFLLQIEPKKSAEIVVKYVNVLSWSEA
ncbi:hypothetical protein J7384_05395 [Endozoicomonas sp. G2_1]|uniref:alpha/beta hydrolase n=1 Tax=Endozoicomonas sp. G2_1 TaxID=2821091 RepID=UPI001ADD0700|nr:alpha/beta hydrolase [Endozoicomonas sp. G2_1]MBO9489790.1 hypothetical protein [Endozoicomonas sp. G2_1]